MGMNNVYYRALHLMKNPEYATLPARLRMNILANPGVDKVDFELWSTAVSAVNGCGMCLDAHENELKKHAVPSVNIQAALADRGGGQRRQPGDGCRARGGLGPLEPHRTAPKGLHKAVLLRRFAGGEEASRSALAGGIFGVAGEIAGQAFHHSARLMDQGRAGGQGVHEQVRHDLVVGAARGSRGWVRARSAWSGRPHGPR